MKTILKRLILCFPALLLLGGCTVDVFSPRGDKQQNPQMTIEAWTESALTKTLLSGEPGDTLRSICFLPLDSIAYSADLGEFKPFVNQGSDTLPYATFTGDLSDANMYFAVYPWKQAVNLNSDTLLMLNLPYVQQYKADGFASGAYPMVSWSYDTYLYFKNLCGLLKLNLRGEVLVSSLSLCAPGLAGLAGVDMTYQGVPQIIMPTPLVYDTLLLDCGEGVQLNAEQATPFYFVLPPALYDSITLIVRTTDQQQMTTTTHNLRIVRSSITPTSVIEFVSDNNPTPTSDTIWDIQGNVYNTVVIGTQTWTTGNLRSSLLNDGTAIPLITDNSTWSNLTTPGYCWYNNDPAVLDDYGPLYNWFTVETAKLCPQGWHVPSNAEWTDLINYLGGLSLASFKMKETGTMYWSSPNEGATNESGFSARGSGRREYFDGQFGFLNRNAYWWSNTQYDTELSYALYLSDVNTNVESYYFDKAYGFSVRCIKDTIATLAITTSPVTSITANSAQSGGNITSDGGSPITVRGLCWNSSGDPTTADYKTEEGSGTGEFTGTMTSLQANTTYYVRAYATNTNNETVYGNSVEFKTAHITSSQFIDLRDGNIYSFVLIGDQFWMAENLRYLPDVVGPGSGSETSAYYYVYDYEGINVTDAKATANYSTYGVLYNWPAAMAGSSSSSSNPSGVQGICPTGWHLPSDAEWKQLEMFLGMTQEEADGTDWRGTDEGGKLKESGTIHWVYPNEASTDASGFTALPTGCRVGLSFSGGGYYNFLWSATENNTSIAWSRWLSYNSGGISRTSYSKEEAFSVRCLKDPLTSVVTTSPVTSITAISAQSGGNITYDGGSPITVRGLCWNSSGDPTTADYKTEEGSGIGEFTSTMTGLQPNTTYYVRAYASSDSDTSYGESLTFTTLSEGSGSGILLEDNFDVYPSEQDWSFDIGDGMFMHQDSKAILMTNYNRYTVKFYSKLQRSVNEGSLTFVSNMLTYEDNNTAYGPLSRGLVSGTDRNNAIEFINISGSVIQARTVSGGVATTTDYNVGASVNNYYDYKIVASNSRVDFYFNNTLIATHTTNIPLVPLNVYFDTSSWAGNVPVSIDYVRLELDPY
jgi:uncharacterized protein (TIGR02145 family)